MTTMNSIPTDIPTEHQQRLFLKLNLCYKVVHVISLISLPVVARGNERTLRKTLSLYFNQNKNELFIQEMKPKKTINNTKEITQIYNYSDKSDNNITTKCKFMLKCHISSPVKCISPKSHYKPVRGMTIPFEDNV